MITAGAEFRMIPYSAVGGSRTSACCTNRIFWKVRASTRCCGACSWREQDEELEGWRAEPLQKQKSLAYCCRGTWCSRSAVTKSELGRQTMSLLVQVLLEKMGKMRFICNKSGRNFLREKRTVFYIGGSDTLPPPLSAEEEQQAVRAFMGGSKKARDLFDRA